MDILNRIVRNPFKVLLTVYRNDDINLSEIRKYVNINYSYLHRITNLMEKEKLLKFDIVSRKKYLKLTENGIKIAELMDKIEKMLDTQTQSL